MFTALLILVVGFTTILATDYILLIDDPDIYSNCIDGPPGSQGINDAFDTSEMLVDVDPDGIHVSGNVTSIWNTSRTDRISVRVLRLNHSRIKTGLQNYFTYRPEWACCTTTAVVGNRQYLTPSHRTSALRCSIRISFGLSTGSKILQTVKKWKRSASRRQV